MRRLFSRPWLLPALMAGADEHFVAKDRERYGRALSVIGRARRAS
jgi:hypothetical protein